MDSAAAQPASPVLRQIVIDLGVMSVIGLFLGIIGPFATSALPLAPRLASWLAFAYVGYAIYRPMGLLVLWGQRRLALPQTGLWVVAVVLGTFPMTLAVQLISSVPEARIWSDLEDMTGTYASVLVIGGGVTLLFNALRTANAAPVVPVAYAVPPPVPAPAAAPAPVPAPAPPPPNPLLDQLPAELGSDIVALEMEDHYVRVHTALGSALVLMRLRDAMALVAEVEGMQVHRSWWVARGAVEDVLRDGRNVRLRLPRGIEAPVARAKIADLRNARWL
jgi:hypothetical protein